ncbi:MAG: DUF5362 family protein [Flavobacterium sp.]
MEYNSPFESFELQVSAAASDFLRTAAKWAMFLAILGFIGIALMVLFGLIALAAGSAVDSAAYEGMEGMEGVGAAARFSPMIGGVIYLVAAILYIFPVIYLYKFASNAKEAVNSNNSEKLTASLENLKSHYKFVGIATIITIVGSIAGVIAMAAMFASAMGGQM